MIEPTKEELAELNERKGASSRAKVPPRVLELLNAGVLETKTLSEWLAIDMTALLGVALVRCNIATCSAERVLEDLGEASDEGIMKRFEIGGRGIRRELNGMPAGKRRASYEALATYSSDMARAFAAYSLMADESVTLPKRFDETRRFAADDNMSVRECAWFTLRATIIDDLKKSIKQLKNWAIHPDPNLRRCAIEGTRPRGVWCPHHPELRKDPEPGLILLEFVKSDESRYVQTAVGNWLNDASKDHPEWVQSVCDRWLSESPTKETKWIVKHATRTIRKNK